MINLISSGFRSHLKGNEVINFYSFKCKEVIEFT